MLNFQQKKRLRNTVHSRITLGILLIFVVLLGHATFNAYSRYKEAKMKENREVNELYKLEGRKKILDEDITRLQSERGIEEEMRSRYGVVKNGEKIIVVVDSKQNKKTKKGSNINGNSFWDAIIDIFR